MTTNFYHQYLDFRTLKVIGFQAMNNLLVLARDSETGASRVWSEGRILEPLLNIMRDKSVDEELLLAATRVLDEVMKKSDRVRFLTHNKRTSCFGFLFHKFTRRLIFFTHSFLWFDPLSLFFCIM